MSKEAFQPLESAQLEPSYGPPRYRKDAPPDRALVFRQGDVTRVLGYIGPGMDYQHDSTGLDQKLGFYEFDHLPDGVWIWEGVLRSEKDSYFHEWEIELVGEHRPLTPEEVERFADGDHSPWDDSLWLVDLE